MISRRLGATLASGFLVASLLAGGGPAVAAEPAAPVSAVLATPGDRQATITWQPPADADSVTVTTSPGGRATTVPAAAATAILDGLDYGVTYTFSVTAHGTGGDRAVAVSNPVRTEGGSGNGRTVGGVLKADTLWLASAGSYTIGSTVQVAQQRRLYLGPGVAITGAVSPLFLVHGLLRAAGTSEAPVGISGGGDNHFFSTQSSPPTAGVELDHALLRHGASIMPATGYEQYAYLRLTNSTVTGMRVRSYLYYPQRESVVEGNIFADSAGFTVNADSRTDRGAVITFRYNRFTTAPTNEAWVVNNAAYGAPIVVYRNTFAVPGSPALRLPPGYNSAAIDARHNYWGTTDRDVVAQMVFDADDDIRSAGRIVVDPMLSEDATETPDATPYMPTQVTATRGDQELAVAWTAPISTGGRPITGYAATAEPGGATCATTGATTCRIDGLVNGTAYQVRVSASNDLGAGPTSSPSTPTTPAGLPGAPSGLTTTARSGQIEATWKPADPRGSAITSYRVTAEPGSATCVTPATSCVLRGLTNEVAHTLSVRATNDVGTGPAVVSDPTVPSALPTAPTVYRTISRDRAVEVSWMGDGSQGTTFYEATASPGGAACTSPEHIWGCTITGLTNGTAYTITVRATNSTGTGPASAPSEPVIPAGPPGTVAGSSIRTSEAAGNLTVRWAAPADNGDPITGYTVRSNPEGRVCTTTGEIECTFAQVTPGVRYDFSVTAANRAGSGRNSDYGGEGIVPTAPGTSTPRAFRGDGAATVWWLPAEDHGRAITSYEVTAAPGGASCTTSRTTSTSAGQGELATSCTVGGLSNGTAYTFTLRATNEIGTGPASAPSAPVVPAGTPNAPSDVAVNHHDGAAEITWSPADGNGSQVTGYKALAYLKQGERYFYSGRTCTSDGPTACTIDGLTNGSIYQVRVLAISDTGSSPETATSSTSADFMPVGPPSAPSNLRGAGGDAKADLYWAAADANGAEITRYVVTASPGGHTCVVPPTTLICSISGLTNDVTYVFTVRGVNSAGAGPESAPLRLTPEYRDIAPPVARASGPTGATSRTTAEFHLGGQDTGGDTDVPASYRCGLDSEDLRPCTSPVRYTGLTNGVHTFEVVATDAAGNHSAPVRLTWRVDTSAPRVSVATLPRFVLGPSITLRYSGTDTGSGVADYDVRYRSATYNGTFGAFVYPRGSGNAWQATKATTVTSTATAGQTYCFSSRVRDKAGNTSAWSGEQCSSTPVDDRSTSASTGWTRGKHRADLAGTYSATKTRGATLTLTNVRGRHLALMVTTGRGYGRVGVYADGNLVRTLDLNATTTAHRKVVTVASLVDATSRTITIRALDKELVRIDGFFAGHA